MTTLRRIIATDSHRAIRVEEDAAILDGFEVTAEGDLDAEAIGAPYKWGHGVTMSRGMMLACGLVEPTPQERADQEASIARSRIRVAAKIARQAEWFVALHAAAGPVGGAMLALHVPGQFGECEGDGFEDLAGLPWPCATVHAAAEAAGIDVPEDI